MPAFLGYPGAGLSCINTGHHFISLPSFILMLCFLQLSYIILIYVMADMRYDFI